MVISVFTESIIVVLFSFIAVSSLVVNSVNEVCVVSFNVLISCFTSSVTSFCEDSILSKRSLKSLSLLSLIASDISVLSLLIDSSNTFLASLTSPIVLEIPRPIPATSLSALRPAAATSEIICSACGLVAQSPATPGTALAVEGSASARTFLDNSPNPIISAGLLNGVLSVSSFAAPKT